MGTKVGAACIWMLLLVSAIVFFGFAREASLQQKSRMSLASHNLSAPEAWRLYDSDPNHIWNRLYRALYRREARDGREYGYDELDPLLWPDTKYLLTKPAYQQTVSALDEFLSTHAERAITDPLKRAILQRDLWAVFDWTTTLLANSPEKLSLQIKLVEVIKRLALSPEQIAALPNSYVTAVEAKAFATTYDLNLRERGFVPPKLFDPEGPWVMLSARGGSPVASTHVAGFSGRSVFLVFLNLPQGRAETHQYLKRISDFSKAWLPDPKAPGRRRPNPELPQFPAGTQLALVREMALVDAEGQFRRTNIVEEIQIRVHRSIPRDIPDALNTSRNEARTALDVYEFKLDRPKLFAGESGGLRAVAAGETEFPIFMSHGIDVFEHSSETFSLERALRPTLQTCSSCHFQPGIHGVLSRKREGILPSWDLNYEADNTKSWKQRQFSWGLLQGLWNSRSR